MSLRIRSTSSAGAGLLVVLAIGAFILLVLFDGFVLMTVWNWFMPQIFPAVPAITFVGALGLRLVAGVLQSRNSDDEPGKTLVTGLAYSVVVLVMGFIIQSFI